MSVVTRDALLQKIQQLIAAEPLWPASAFDNVKSFKDKDLKVLLILLFNFNRARKAIGTKSDFIVKMKLKKQMKYIQRLARKETTTVMVEFEAKEQDQEYRAAESLLVNLNQA